jgi:putative N-acetylmannosamine-6-phosphate epimerase
MGNIIKKASKGKYIGLVHHVEQTEHKKFRKVPIVYVVKRDNRMAHNNIKRTVNDKGQVKKVNSASINITDNFQKRYKAPFVRAVLMHELRENLYMQHGIDKHTKSKVDKSVHSHAQKWIKKDELWAKKHPTGKA